MDLSLATRGGLPEPLRLLLAEFPRATWEGHANFGGLVAFWLDRHLLFRRLLDLLETDVRALQGGELDPALWAPRLSGLGGRLVSDLHGHHRIEDDHYFPLLARAEPRLETGFGLLDADHHALDDHLAGFVAAANAALSAEEAGRAPAAGRFGESLARLHRLLDRHLADEEDLIVPVILRDGERFLGG